MRKIEVDRGRKGTDGGNLCELRGMRCASIDGDCVEDCSRRLIISTKQREKGLGGERAGSGYQNVSSHGYHWEVDYECFYFPSISKFFLKKALKEWLIQK